MELISRSDGLWNPAVIETALITYADLFHVRRIVPEQPLFDHYAVFPVPHGAHGNGKLLSRGLNEFPVTDRHGFGKGPGHNSYYGGIFP